MTPPPLYPLRHNLHTIMHAALSGDLSSLYVSRDKCLYDTATFYGKWIRWIDSWHTRATESVHEIITTVLKAECDQCIRFVATERDKRINDALSSSPKTSMAAKRKYREWVGEFSSIMELFLTVVFKPSINHTTAFNAFLKLSSSLVEAKVLKIIRKEENWIECEGILQKEIPLNALFKWATTSPPFEIHLLQLQEKKTIQQWVQAIRECESQLSVHLLTEVLFDIAENIPNNCLSQLCNLLKQEGVTLIDDEDAHHLDYRESLKEGDVVFCNGERVILGEKLGPVKRTHNRFQLFAVQGSLKWAVKIASNRLLLHLEEQQKQEATSVFSSVALISNIARDGSPLISGLDTKGTLAIVERLYAPLHEYSWKSQSPILDPEDEAVALPLANHIAAASLFNITPESLSLNHLMWDVQGRLTATKPFKKGDEDYLRLEHYCSEASCRNGYVLNFLIHVSGLYEHPIAIYLRDAIAATLETGKTDLLARPLPEGYDNIKYKIAVEQLTEEAKTLTFEVFSEVVSYLRENKMYSSDASSELNQEIRRRCASLYRLSPTPGNLSHIKEAAIAHWTQLTVPYNENHKLEEIEKYYFEMRQTMEHYNRLLSNS